jgi:hypothetical protein
MLPTQTLPLSKPSVSRMRACQLICRRTCLMATKSRCSSKATSWSRINISLRQPHHFNQSVVVWTGTVFNWMLSGITKQEFWLYELRAFTKMSAEACPMLPYTWNCFEWLVASREWASEHLSSSSA